MLDRTEQDIMKNWRSKENPVVSVCCTTYNHENYISDALDGFLMQETDFPFEVVVRDDCSTDQTAMIIKKYVAKYPNIIKPIFEELNQYSKGVRPMPVVLNESLGDYLALCEGDDYWVDKKKLKKQVGFLEDNYDYFLCYTGATLVDDNGFLLVKNKSFGDSNQDKLISGLGNAITGSVMFRKFDWSEFSKLDVANGDTLLWHFLGFYGKCKCLNDINNTVYRIHNNGVWSGRSERDKLMGSLKTYAIIRTRIVNNFYSDSYILSMHDSIYRELFNNYLSISLKKSRINDYFFGFFIILKLDYINKYQVLKFHFNNILKKTYKMFDMKG
jgi:glycosyltransferase involved in cell wall biosynthesis